jgi:hypothetical protein
LGPPKTPKTPSGGGSLTLPCSVTYHFCMSRHATWHARPWAVLAAVVIPWGAHGAEGPVLETVEPDTVIAGGLIEVRGHDLDVPAVVTATVGGVPAHVLESDAFHAVIALPLSLRSGSQEVRVWVSGIPTNVLQVAIRAPELRRPRGYTIAIRAPAYESERGPFVITGTADLPDGTSISVDLWDLVRGDRIQDLTARVSGGVFEARFGPYELPLAPSSFEVIATFTLSGQDRAVKIKLIDAFRDDGRALPHFLRERVRFTLPF